MLLSGIGCTVWCGVFWVPFSQYSLPVTCPTPSPCYFSSYQCYPMLICTPARAQTFISQDCCQPRSRARPEARRPSSIRGGTPELERPVSTCRPAAGAGAGTATSGAAVVPAGQWHRATSIASVSTRGRDTSIACGSSVGGFCSNIANAVVVGGGSFCGSGRSGVGVGKERGWRRRHCERASEQQQIEGGQRRGWEGAGRCVRWRGDGT